MGAVDHRQQQGTHTGFSNGLLSLLCKTKGHAEHANGASVKHQQRALYPLLLHIRASRSHLQQGHLSGTPPTPPVLCTITHTYTYVCTPSQPLSRAATTRNTHRAL